MIFTTFFSVFVGSFETTDCPKFGSITVKTC